MPRPLKYPLPPIPVRTESASIRIAKYRKLHGLTQKQLADKIGITRSLLSRYESGITRLNDDLIVRFALALRISTDELLGLSKNKPGLENSPSIRFVQRMQRIARLSTVNQKAILRTIDSFLDGAESHK
jgi:transcriptional regulator with XRE-family HTH domain